MATLKNTVINDTGNLTLPVGTTAQRPASPTVGMIRYNTTLGFSEQYTVDGWQGIAPPPVITSISPTSFNGESGTSITVNGANFDSTATVQFILFGGAVVNATTTTRVSSSQLTATTGRDFLASESPASIKVNNGSGLAATIDAALTFAAGISFNSSAGSIGTIYDASRSNQAQLSSLAASDAASGTIASYSIVSGAVPTGLSFNTSTAALTGTASAVGTDTTYSFTVRATDNAGNTLDRAFTCTVRAPIVQSFTSVGTTSFSVPTGVVNAQVLVIAGGGGGGTRNSGPNSSGTDGGSGGGAGGMIDHPAFPLTPGGTVSVTVGGGGAGGTSGQTPGNKGSDSVFGTLTAIGGGYGGCGPLSPNPGGPGGSGGGEGGGGGSPAGDTPTAANGSGGGGGTGVQSGQPGASGTYGYGFPGGHNGPNAPQVGSGGGGASASGGVGGRPATDLAGPGGAGRSSSISGSSVAYAGGGGGGGAPGNGSSGGSGGNGGGGPGGPVSSNGVAGTPGRGGGGGGGSGGPGPGGQGGEGGPGVVIVRY